MTAARRLLSRPGTLCALALLVLGVWEVGRLTAVAGAAPHDADWRRAAQVVRDGFAPGDLIVFAPPWVDPVGRKWLGDLMRVEDAARMDEARYGRIWEVSIRGASAGAVGEPQLDEHVGAVHVRRLDHAPALVAWDTRAASRLYEVDFAPRLCVPLRPPQRFDAGQVPLGKTLAVYAGIADFRSRRDNRADAELRVVIDGATVATARVGNDSGWMPLPPIATAPGAHRLALESAVVPGRGQSQSPAHLDLCVAAEARE
jgi:hypothetical protein